MSIPNSAPVPIHHSGPSGDRSPTLDIKRTLAPVRRGIGLGRILRRGLVGFTLGAGAGTILLFVARAARMQSLDFAIPASFGLAAIGIILGIAVGLSQWPHALEAARTADRYFNLHDRLTTALELHTSNQPFAVLQRLDVASQVDGLVLARSRGRWLQWREIGITALVAVVFCAALAMTSADHAQHGSTAGVQNTQHTRRAAARVKQLSSRLNTGLSQQQRRSAAMRELSLALSRLHWQLLHTSSQREALRSISATQQQLHSLASGLHPINSKAVAQLTGSLGHYLPSEGANGHAGTTARSALAAARALNRLAQSLAHLSASQRAALARALARAANTSSSATMRSHLQQAASSLAYNDPQSADSALQQAAQALARTPGSQAALSRLAAAGNQLDALKNQISRAAGNDGPGHQPGKQSNANTGQGTGKRSGYGQGTGKNEAGGLGRGRGKGRGSRFGTGRGNASRHGRGAARGTVQGRGASSRQQGSASSSGQGVSSAHGTGAGVGRAGQNGRGQNSTVYIPAKQGKGPDVIQTGPNGAPAQGNIVPYHQVVAQYEQSAHQALDRAALPSPLQGYVRRYFSAISR